MDGASVGVLDADIYGPSIPLMLGVNKKPKLFKTDSGTKMEPVESYGLKLISIGFLKKRNASKCSGLLYMEKIQHGKVASYKITLVI